MRRGDRRKKRTGWPFMASRPDQNPDSIQTKFKIQTRPKTLFLLKRRAVERKTLCLLKKRRAVERKTLFLLKRRAVGRKTLFLLKKRRAVQRKTPSHSVRDTVTFCSLSIIISLNRNKPKQKKTNLKQNNNRSGRVEHTVTSAQVRFFNLGMSWAANIRKKKMENAMENVKTLQFLGFQKRPIAMEIAKTI
jgi:hypothetical protein